MSTLFKETQTFNHWLPWTLIIGITLIPIYGIYEQLYLGRPFGDTPSTDAELILFLVIMLAIIGLFAMMSLKTEITTDKIKMSFSPFVKRTIYWNEVSSAKVLNYGFVGGWGIRLCSKYGTVYNTKGNMGLALEYSEDKKICIGTQRAEELKNVLAKIGHPQKN